MSFFGFLLPSTYALGGESFWIYARAMRERDRRLDGFHFLLILGPSGTLSRYWKLELQEPFCHAAFRRVTSGAQSSRQSQQQYYSKESSSSF